MMIGPLPMINTCLMDLSLGICWGKINYSKDSIDSKVAASEIESLLLQLKAGLHECGDNL